VGSSLTFIEGDIRSLDGLPDGTYDVAISLGGPVSYCGAPAQALAAMAERAGLGDVEVGAEFMFVPDDRLRVGDDLERWEQAVLALEMAYSRDVRFLGAAGLLVEGRKPS